MLRIECRLVHVNSYSPESLFSCCFDNTYSTSAGSMINHISTSLVLRKSIFFSELGIVKSSCVVDYYFSIRVYCFYPCFKTILEFFNQCKLHPANKSNFVCFSHESCNNTCQEGSFMFLESKSCRIWGIHYFVDYCKFLIRKLRRGFSRSRLHQKSYRNNQIRTIFSSR